ncbi:hypothetical protein DORFOR_01362 [Dorea formicigenerans ATCC 27755]|uniref:Uncharacterized protein n=1 Tax=Dorea formicigenerans ATCC 27755 TaxID=411461 RepID=B0G522_9FIRM|nr:hypothetical protein DORFOR_01362 [Dorea formicigenerans ATCC 27755]
MRILPEAFCIIGNAISYYTKKIHRSCNGSETSLLAEACGNRTHPGRS